MVEQDNENYKNKGLRFNNGKVRYDLLPNFAINQMTNVFTKGSFKYDERNWERGMAWSTCIASLKRHIAKFEEGEDFDDETGLLHVAHAMTNCAFLVEYYKIYPQGDDRQHGYLNNLRIGLDIDDVICDFVGGYAEKYSCGIPKNWKFSYSVQENLRKLHEQKGALNEFYLSLKPKENAELLKFEPVCYITQREVDVKITQQWIETNGFPCVPVHSIGFNESKVEIALQEKLDIFIDDKYETFVEMNKAGICTYLFDNEHNRKYDVGYKRIYSLNDIFLKNKYSYK